MLAQKIDSQQPKILTLYPLHARLPDVKGILRCRGTCGNIIETDKLLIQLNTTSNDSINIRFCNKYGPESINTLTVREPLKYTLSNFQKSMFINVMLDFVCVDNILYMSSDLAFMKCVFRKPIERISNMKFLTEFEECVKQGKSITKFAYSVNQRKLYVSDVPLKVCNGVANSVVYYVNPTMYLVTVPNFFMIPDIRNYFINYKVNPVHGRRADCKSDIVIITTDREKVTDQLHAYIEANVSQASRKKLKRIRSSDDESTDDESDMKRPRL
jgi:hypothetical protein